MSTNLPQQREKTWPSSMPELTLAELLLIRAFRRWCLGIQLNAAHHLSILRDAFTEQLGGEDGKLATASFVTLLVRLQDQARHQIHYHQPYCPCIGADEVWLVSFVGALQHGDFLHARYLAEWMVCEDGVGGLLEAGGSIASTLRTHSLEIPNRHRSGRPAKTGPNTIH